MFRYSRSFLVLDEGSSSCVISPGQRLGRIVSELLRLTQPSSCSLLRRLIISQRSVDALTCRSLHHLHALLSSMSSRMLDGMIPVKDCSSHKRRVRGSLTTITGSFLSLLVTFVNTLQAVSQFLRASSISFCSLQIRGKPAIVTDLLPTRSAIHADHNSFFPVNYCLDEAQQPNG